MIFIFRLPSATNEYGDAQEKEMDLSLRKWFKPDFLKNPFPAGRFLYPDKSGLCPVRTTEIIFAFKFLESWLLGIAATEKVTFNRRHL